MSSGLPIPPKLLALDMRGTVTLYDSAPVPNKYKVVFQGCSPASANYFVGNNKPRMLRAHVIPTDPKTPAQLARRDLLAAAVAAWHLLDASAKQGWYASGKERQISGFNAFISNYLTA